jgi:hypothetical protein
MKWVKKYELFKESKHNKISKNIIKNICISMILLNNEFLDNILDRGLKSRYQENSNIFITDLKNLLLAKNRLKLGKFIDKKCVEDDNTSKINYIFENLEFDIEKDWKMLVDSRITARNIIDKLLPDNKLDSDSIKSIYLNFNNDGDDKEDIIIETDDDKQYSFYLDSHQNTRGHPN